MDWASVSRLLHQLCFHVWYLVAGGGHIMRHDGKASDKTKRAAVMSVSRIYSTITSNTVAILKYGHTCLSAIC